MREGQSPLCAIGDAAACLYFDFGEAGDPIDTLPLSEPALWHVQPNSPHAGAYVIPASKASFIDQFLNGAPLRTYDASALLRRVSMPPPLPSFARHLGQPRRARFLFCQNSCKARQPARRPWHFLNFLPDPQ